VSVFLINKRISDSTRAHSPKYLLRKRGSSFWNQSLAAMALWWDRAWSIRFIKCQGGVRPAKLIMLTLLDISLNVNFEGQIGNALWYLGPTDQ
jgi:hypothetical protein